MKVDIGLEVCGEVDADVEICFVVESERASPSLSTVCKSEGRTSSAAPMRDVGDV